LRCSIGCGVGFDPIYAVKLRNGRNPFTFYGSADAVTMRDDGVVDEAVDKLCSNCVLP